MMTADPNQNNGYPRDADTQSTADSPHVIAELVTVVLCGPSAVLLMVTVAFHGWPPWLLVVAGMLVAWTGEALWTLGEHTLAAALARRTARVLGSRGESGARHDPGHARLREQTRSGDHQ